MLNEQINKNTEETTMVHKEAPWTTLQQYYSPLYSDVSGTIYMLVQTARYESPSVEIAVTVEKRRAIAAAVRRVPVDITRNQNNQYANNRHWSDHYGQLPITITGTNRLIIIFNHTVSHIYYKILV